MCVLSYYYQLCDKKNARIIRTLQRRAARAARRNEEFNISAIDNYGVSPPAYNVIFKNPVFEGDDDKLPSYEESVEGNQIRRSVDNQRF